MHNSCSFPGTVDELLKYPTDLLVLVGHDGQSDSDDDDDEDEDGAGDSDDDSSGDDGDEDGGDEPLTPEEVADLRKKLTNYEQERERNVRKRKDAQGKVSDLQRQLDEMIAKGAVEEDVKKELEQLRKERDQLKKTVQNSSLDLAFYRSNTHEWQNPKAVLKLVNRDELELEDDGSVNGLSEELDRIAREEPYLLKPKAPKGQGRKPAEKTGVTPRPSGSNDSKSQKSLEAKLRAKYPALRR